MRFERSFDYGLIKKIATHPRVYSMSGDDFSPPPMEWEPIRNDLIWYVLAYDDGELLGMFVLIPENAICWNIHVCLLPNSWGARARQTGQEVVQWIFEHTSCLRLVADVPEYNTLVLKLGLLAGMERYGVNAKSHKKNGTLYDQIQLGISKGVN